MAERSHAEVSQILLDVANDPPAVGNRLVVVALGLPIPVSLLQQEELEQRLRDAMPLLPFPPPPFVDLDHYCVAHVAGARLARRHPHREIRGTALRRRRRILEAAYRRLERATTGPARAVVSEVEAGRWPARRYIAAAEQDLAAGRDLCYPDLQALVHEHRRALARCVPSIERTYPGAAAVCVDVMRDHDDDGRDPGWGHETLVAAVGEALHGCCKLVAHPERGLRATVVESFRDVRLRRSEAPPPPLPPLPDPAFRALTRRAGHDAPASHPGLLVARRIASIAADVLAARNRDRGTTTFRDGLVASGVVLPISTCTGQLDPLRPPHDTLVSRRTADVFPEPALTLAEEHLPEDIRVFVRSIVERLGEEG